MPVISAEEKEGLLSGSFVLVEYSDLNETCVIKESSHDFEEKKNIF